MINIKTLIIQNDSLNIDEILNLRIVDNDEYYRIHDFIFSDKSENSGKNNYDTALYGSLTVGDFIYDVSRVDPTILDAIEFARPGDVSNIFNFAYFANHIDGLDKSAYIGNINQLSGYVAERLVAQQLQSQGFEIDFPDHPNQTGFDLLVNGHPFQVKCLDSPQGVYEHFENYPDIPVLINEDLADQIDGLDNVYPVHGIDHDQIVEATESTLDDGASMLDFEIPLISIAVASGRNVISLIKRETNISAAFKNVTFDVVTGTAGGKVGAKVLGVIGGMVFGPAGLVIGGISGSVIGYRTSKPISSWIKGSLFTKQEEHDLEELLKKFMILCEAEVKKSILILDNKIELYYKSLYNSGNIKSILWERINWQIHQEKKYKEKNLKKISQAINNPMILDLENNDVLVAAGEGMLLAADSGVHIHSVRSEIDLLAKSMEKLQKVRTSYFIR